MLGHWLHLEGKKLGARGCWGWGGASWLLQSLPCLLEKQLLCYSCT